MACAKDVQCAGVRQTPTRTQPPHFFSVGQTTRRRPSELPQAPPPLRAGQRLRPHPRCSAASAPSHTRTRPRGQATSEGRMGQTVGGPRGGAVIARRRAGRRQGLWHAPNVTFPSNCARKFRVRHGLRSLSVCAQQRPVDPSFVLYAAPRASLPRMLSCVDLTSLPSLACLPPSLAPFLAPSLALSHTFTG